MSPVSSTDTFSGVVLVPWLVGGRVRACGENHRWVSPLFQFHVNDNRGLVRSHDPGHTGRPGARSDSCSDRRLVRIRQFAWTEGFEPLRHSSSRGNQAAHGLTGILTTQVRSLLVGCDFDRSRCGWVSPVSRWVSPVSTRERIIGGCPQFPFLGFLLCPD